MRTRMTADAEQTMSANRQMLVFYSAVTMLTAFVWLVLMRFARLPSGVDGRFVSAIFVPYLFGIVALSGWFEARRKRKVKEPNRTAGGN